MRNRARWWILGLLLLGGVALSSSGALASIPVTPVPPLGSGGQSAGAGLSRPHAAEVAASRAKIDPRLLSRFDADPSARVDYLVWMAEQADTHNNIADWNEKGAYVLRKLQDAANATQPAVLRTLGLERTAGNVGSYQGYTIVNAIGVKGGNLASALAVAAYPGVESIKQPREYRPGSVVVAPSAPGGDSLRAATESRPYAWPYGIARIQAPQVWDMGFRGDGVVIGSIDTGVRYTHEALNRQYRGNLGGGNYDHDYNWYDPTALQRATPYDDNGHGSHTTGTVLGDNGDPGTQQIGVAPHAKWMAAKVFPNGGSSSDTEILPAMDFMLAPWPVAQPYENRRPDLRPRAVNNSWGDTYCPNDGEWVAVTNWINAGIFPSFSNGNAGPGAGTVGSPGGFPHTFGIGASGPTDAVAGFSSRGPSCYGGIVKPDVVAPGVGIFSALHTTDTAYGNNQGTSMAAPHDTGSVALLVQVRPSLTISDIMAIITRTADFTPTLMGSRPNNNYGWGRINVLSAATYAMHAPQITGTVSVGSSNVDLATITAVRDDGDTRMAVSDAAGRYQMTLGAGTYTVTVSAFGFSPTTLSAQGFVSDTNYTRNFDLTRSAVNLVRGRVYLDGAGTAVSSTITIDGSPYTYRTNATGNYSVTLPSGTWTMRVNGGIYAQKTVTVTVGGPMTHNIAMNYNRDASYESNPVAFNWITGTTRLTSFTPYFGGISPFDEGYATVALPFSFSFYGTAYSTVYVDSNSFATFIQPTASSNTYVPQRAPSSTTPNAGLYVYWQDTALAPVGSGNNGAVYTGVVGTSPDRTFIIEFRNLSSLGGASSYEILLKESTSEVNYQYLNVDGAFGYGSRASIGIENANGTDGIQSDYKTPGQVGNNMAIRYQPLGLVPTPTATYTPTNTPTPCTMSFSDVHQEDYFYEPVRYLYCHGVISGYGDGTFKPYNNTTRGQLAKIVVLAEGWQIYNPPTPTFQDVPTTDPFYALIETAYNHGIISGYTCGGPGEPCPGLYYRPGNNITRAQLCKIIVLAEGWEITPPPIPTFMDVPPEDAFYGVIETAYAHGIISGYSCGTGCLQFRPGNNATRGQICKIVYLAVTGP